MNDGRAFVVRAIPESERLFEMMIAQGVPLAANTRKLIDLIDMYGVTAVRDQVREAVRREIPRPAFIAMRLHERDKDRRSPPPVPLVLPDRQDVRDMSVVHHDLAAYDQLMESGTTTDHGESGGNDDDDGK